MARLSPQLRKRLFCLLLALVTLATFWSVIHNGFIEYDDDDYIFENPAVRAEVSWSGVAWAFMGMHASNWHPLTWLSHMVDCQLFGLNPGAHHLMNVLIHAANAAVLLWLLDLLTGKFWRSTFVAAVFALHPLRVESVAWAAERKDVLCAFFFLLTLLAYVKCVMRDACFVKPAGNGGENSRSTQHASPPRPRLALLLFLFALLAKPMVVTLPVILLLLDFWPLRRVSGCKLQAASLLLEKWPFFLLSIIFSAVTLFAQHDILPQQTMTVSTRLSHIAADYFSYLEKILWPQDLSFLYLRPEQTSANHLLAAGLVLSGISAWAWGSRRNRPWLIVGWLWFLVMLLPVITVTLNKLCIADRYTYLPGIGFSVMLVWGIAEAVEKFPAKHALRCFSSIAAVAILFFCAARTREQIRCWKNTQTLMEQALKVDPHNDVAAQSLRIYRFEQDHPGVREKHPRANPAAQTPR